MYTYLFPIYWVPDLRVYTSPDQGCVASAICLIINLRSGLIVSYSFSYGLAENDLRYLAMLGLYEQSRSKKASRMYRYTLGNVGVIKRIQFGDYYRLSLTNERSCPRPVSFDWGKAMVLFSHLYNDWTSEFIASMSSFGYVSAQMHASLAARVVAQFNKKVESGAVNFRE